MHRIGPDFVVAGGLVGDGPTRPTVWRSADGVKWTREALGGLQGGDGARCPGWVVDTGTDGHVTVAVGQWMGRPVTWIRTPEGWRPASALPGVGAGGYRVSRVIAAGSRRFLAVGTDTEPGDHQHGVVWSSTDGGTWRARRIEGADYNGLADAATVHGRAVVLGHALDGRRARPVLLDVAGAD